jgi:hypothetical protein
VLLKWLFIGKDAEVVGKDDAGRTGEVGVDIFGKLKKDDGDRGVMCKPSNIAPPSWLIDIVDIACDSFRLGVGGGDKAAHESRSRVTGASSLFASEGAN